VGAYRVLMEPRVTVAGAPEKVVSPAEKGAASSSKHPSRAMRNSGNPNDYLVGGWVCIACAMGLSIMGYFVERIGPGSFFPMAGAGVLVGLAASV